ncbi:PilW family protein [Aquabacterium sp.]|uniref:PilW family protein n=1 Tax=Aquabacterium sp. TaxID=1872578 RepID=UPI0027BA28D2|nr:PilW family protein [Aquabacterium sp.]
MPYTQLRHSPALARSRPQLGFTLIELLVAMLLGLVTVIVVAQVMLMAESRKRTATSGSDATTTGAMALYTMERDARNAGFGMTTNAGALGCEIKAKHGSNATQTYVLAPIVITQGSSGAPDTITFTASTKEGVPLPTKVTVDHPSTAANFFVQSALGITEGDLMIAVPTTPSSTNWCSVFQVTNDTAPGGGNSQGGGQGQNQVLHNSGLSSWNQAGGQTIFPTAGYPAGSTLINLGAMSRRTYSIVSNGLQLTWLNTTDGSSQTRDLYPQVIQLQAEYGTDTDLADNNVRVTNWTTTTPAANDNAGWQAIKAVRVAVVARSNVYEKDVVTATGTGTTYSTCRASSPRAVCWAGGAINNLNTNNPGTDDWQHYRYRVYEAVLPIRNVIWQQ